MKVNYFALLLLTCLLCVISQAQSKTSIVCYDDKLPPKEWITKEVSFIITKQEKEVFYKLENDTDRKKFIENFWLRRDPDPDTVENEYKDEFCERISYANKTFESGIPGWKTDRGRVYLILGKPDSVEKGKKDFKDYKDLKDVVFEKWNYKYTVGFGNNLEIVFLDMTETNEFRFWSKQRESISKMLEPKGVCSHCPPSF